MSAWAKVDQIEPVNLQLVLDEEVARKLQEKECAKVVVEKTKKVKKKQEHSDWASKVKEKPEEELYEAAGIWEPGPSSSKTPDVIPQEVLDALKEEEDTIQSDELIAKLLQAQFDLEYDEQLKREEKAKNKNAKVAISYKNHRLVPEDLVYEDESEIHDLPEGKDWDHFETNDFDKSPLFQMRIQVRRRRYYGDKTRRRDYWASKCLQGYVISSRIFNWRWCRV